MLTNEDIADALERVGDLLQVQDSNPFRVRAYRDAAETVRGLPARVSRLLEEGGASALRELPGIGDALARAVQELVRTGRLALLDRLEGQVCPEDLFQTVPGIGEELARRIHRDRDIESLEALELAAHDGRLERVAGFGPRRVRGIREYLASMLGRATRRRAHGRWGREQGRVAEAGALPRIAHATSALTFAGRRTIERRGFPVERGRDTCAQAEHSGLGFRDVANLREEVLFSRRRGRCSRSHTTYGEEEQGAPHARGRPSPDRRLGDPAAMLGFPPMWTRTRREHGQQ